MANNIKIEVESLLKSILILIKVIFIGQTTIIL
ncbi:hypothetical protein SERP1314 [Staphylococcus epidermidis RP62A]|uniref:Uncharacterized protein n=1 Tax=Staphylococcus epidermidis (strain ATCC 35984 / DSM 28319 / BCRC 17069 / CCUG 31568 / BM 3577 / RP62A) TaxID=176279 RepID=Q5HNF5_STAEQ|nr:hypothetical protein SERP1314 [Staphylococcus epidermidis RP62A]